MTRCSSYCGLATRISNADKTLGAVIAPPGGSDSTNHFGAAKGAKWWGRSRPRRCFVRVLLLWLCSTNVADAALLVACHVLNRDLNGVLNRGKRAPFRSERLLDRSEP